MNKYKQRALNYFCVLEENYNFLKHCVQTKTFAFLSTLLLIIHLIGALFFYAYFLLELSFVPSLGEAVFMPLLLVFGLSGALFFVLALIIGFVSSFVLALLCEKMNAFKFGVFISLCVLFLMIAFAKDKAASISGYGNFKVSKLFLDKRLKGSFECEALLYCEDKEDFVELWEVKINSALGDKYFISVKAKDNKEYYYKIAKVYVLNTLTKKE